MIMRMLLLLASVAFLTCSPLPEQVGGVRTEALDAAAWEASCWISAADAPVVKGKVLRTENCRAADGASWFVSEPVNEKKVTRARWMTAGLGVYELYVNGTLIGEEILKPGFTHYAKTKRSFTYDVTDAFKTAKGAANQLAVQLTPGWWADKIVTPDRHKGMIGRRCAFRGVLELTFEDGSTQLFGTDTEHWKAGIAGPVTHADIYDGEDYDARIRPGYETPEKLSTPVVNQEFNGEILLPRAPRSTSGPTGPCNPSRLTSGRRSRARVKKPSAKSWSSAGTNPDRPCG